MKTEIKTEAQAYADSIAAGLTAWAIAAEWQVAAEEDEDGEAISLADYIADTYPDFKDLAYTSEIAEQLHNVDTIGEAWEVYLSDVLSVELTGTLNGNGWEVTGAKMWVTLGGPNCFIEWNMSAHVAVCCQWGSDRGYAGVYCSGLGEALQCYVEGVTV